ncbi:50S ribosomal protein L23 [Candidatus Dependentiae bacterium]|nr:50S ribosomal protein L23 [Candidatus Dependentiae bacterium]
MDLSIYDIIKGPRISEKAYRLEVVAQRQLVLEVHPHANKSMIKDALKKLFNVEVEKINTLVKKGKTRKLGRRVFQGKTRKRAIITLKEGHSFDMAGLQNVAGGQEG